MDWVVQDEDRLLKIQVKWASRGHKNGLPLMSLRCIEENQSRRYSKQDFDFFIGYDYFTDTAYVYSYEDTAHCESYITITEDAAERWDKLRQHRSVEDPPFGMGKT